MPVEFAITLGTILFGFIIVAVIVLIKACYLVRQAEVIVIERMGKFHRILEPGLHFVTPLIETPRSVTWSFVEENGKHHVRYTHTFSRIDLRESVYDFPKQNVITKDNVTMEINALLYYQITDVKSAIYEINNLPVAIEQITQTTLRDVIGSMNLDQSLTSRSMINERLRVILDDATDKWGVKVNRVELKEINPPADIKQAMEKEMRAERDKRAVILEAEGTKQAAILASEGEWESQVLRARGEAEAEILRADGQAQARLKLATAEAQSIEIIQKAVPGSDPLPYMVATGYMKMLPEMTQGKNDKMIVVPYEATAILGSLSTMKKVFENATN